MDSTLRSNLSVGMPLDLAVIPADRCEIGTLKRIERDDPQFRAVSDAWARTLREGFARIEL
jgi:putative proteasome-type protease